MPIVTFFVFRQQPQPKTIVMHFSLKIWHLVATINVDGDAINIAADHQMFMTLTGELSWQRLRRSAVDFYSKKRKNRFLSHPLGHLGVTYALRLWLVGKPMVDFIFIVIELFSLSPTVETFWVEIGRSRRFSKGGWVTLSAGCRGKGASPTNHCWYQSSRVIAHSCGIK